MFPEPSSQAEIIPSFSGLLISRVTFPTISGSLIEEVYFNITDDKFALEDIEQVTVTLSVPNAMEVDVGEPESTVLNIIDNDGN